MAINAHGDIVGYYSDAAEARHGFLFRQGMYTTIDVPGALATELTGINSQGDIAGAFDVTDGPGGFHGFLVQ
jgi:probable HAF family extracellular repeat protein